MKIGNYELASVDSGRFALDGGAMFGIVPRPLWSRTNPPDEQNRIDLALRLLLLRSPEKNILIDTGIGTKFSEKEQGIYKISTDLPGALAQHDLTPGDITDVILTHLHFDHTGGSTTEKDGELVPTFPSATYHVQQRNFDWGSAPTERDRGSYLDRDFAPLQEHGKLNLLDGPGEIFEGVHLEIMEGHTTGQQLVRVTDGKNTVFFCADLFPTASHVPLPYIMGYDLRPLETLAEKKRILPRALEENWILFFEHDPTTEAVRVTEGKKGIGVGEKVTLASMA